MEGERRRSGESKVKLAKNRLILDQIYSTLSLPPLQSKRTISRKVTSRWLFDYSSWVSLGKWVPNKDQWLNPFYIDVSACLPFAFGETYLPFVGPIESYKNWSSFHLNFGSCLGERNENNNFRIYFPSLVWEF